MPAHSAIMIAAGIRIHWTSALDPGAGGPASRHLLPQQCQQRQRRPYCESVMLRLRFCRRTLFSIPPSSLCLRWTGIAFCRQSIRDTPICIGLLYQTDCIEVALRPVRTAAVESRCGCRFRQCTAAGRDVDSQAVSAIDHAALQAALAGEVGVYTQAATVQETANSSPLCCCVMRKPG